MLLRSRPISGRHRASLLAAVLTTFLVASGCVYSFTGGGLPRHVRTIAIIPFEEEVAGAMLGTEIELVLRDELPRRLGVRISDASVADAVVRGRITGYDESAPGVLPGSGATGVRVVQNRIRITVEAEIYDQREDRPLWRAGSLSVEGNYAPDREQASVGRSRAIEDLVQRITEGAQSQW